MSFLGSFEVEERAWDRGCDLNGPLDSVQDAVAAIARGEFVVVVDDEDRENEGDLILAAEFATPKKIGFMIRHTGGVLCVAMPEDRAARLDLPQMVARNCDSMGTAFTVTVDAKAGLTTGISATERAGTIAELARIDAEPGDFVRPGHVFPLVARPGGVLERPGHTEAAVDLARLAGVQPVGALSEIVDPGGEVLRFTDLRRFARAHGLCMISIEALRVTLKEEPPIQNV